MNGATVHKFDPPIGSEKGNSFEFTATYPLSTGEITVSKKELNKKF